MFFILKFCFVRYIKKSDLSGTQVIMTSQVEGNEKGDELQKKFDDYKHPETNRLMSQVYNLLIYINKIAQKIILVKYFIHFICFIHLIFNTYKLSNLKQIFASIYTTCTIITCLKIL